MPEELPVPTNAPPLTVSDRLVWILPNTYGLPSVPTQEGFVDAATAVAIIAAGTFDCPLPTASGGVMCGLTVCRDMT